MCVPYYTTRCSWMCEKIKAGFFPLFLFIKIDLEHLLTWRYSVIVMLQIISTAAAADFQVHLPPPPPKKRRKVFWPNCKWSLYWKLALWLFSTVTDGSCEFCICFRCCLCLLFDLHTYPCTHWLIHAHQPPPLPPCIYAHTHTHTHRGRHTCVHTFTYRVSML